MTPNRMESPAVNETPTDTLTQSVNNKLDATLADCAATTTGADPDLLASEEPVPRGLATARRWAPTVLPYIAAIVAIFALALLLTGCTDPTTQPNPAPAPAPTTPAPQDIEAELLCAATGPGKFTGQYAWSGGELVPICTAP